MLWRARPSVKRESLHAKQTNINDQLVCHTQIYFRFQLYTIELLSHDDNDDYISLNRDIGPAEKTPLLEVLCGIR